ncbi:MAG: Smr/MutS family protein [Methylotenera sp.]|nr:Smr/MutS family protein [Oligoflexia bacterium]
MNPPSTSEPQVPRSISTVAVQSLEWPRFLLKAEAEARTQTAKATIRLLAQVESWAQDVETARILQQETQEISLLLEREALWGPLQDLQDPQDLFESLNRGSVLEVAEFASLRGWLHAIDSWVQTPRESLHAERFSKALSMLSDPHEPLRVLERILTPEGELSEKASPRLAAIHTEIRGLKREIGIVLDQLVKTFSQKGVLQENFTDLRDGRFVIPVKISSQNEVEGIIYEASASRQTVFIEPKEVAQLNNRLRQRQNDLIQEIFIILEATSKAIAPFSGEIESSVAIISHWDAVQAKAQLGRHYSGKMIQVSEGSGFELHQTAHPLLWWSLPVESITRNEIEFGDPTRTLLLTGPNTGGKTVLLKTLGIAGVCARTGFQFPGTDIPTVPFFDSFFVDVGDAQSIENHLSSFSGHILRFKEILENVTSKSLVLIDELNTATDPGEGGALGRAFLETVMARGAVIVATTHDPQLKALSMQDSRILNASMAFDESSRSPTYRMLTGIPGRSRALETAERLGLPPEVLVLARKYLSAEHIEFEGLLARLESDTHEIARSRKEAVHAREEAERLRKEWTARTESSVNEMLDRTRQKLRRILEQAQDEVRTSVRKLDDIKNRREVDQTRSTLNQTLTRSADQIESALQEEAPELASSLHIIQVEKKVQQAPLLSIGARVRIPKWKSLGEILEISGNKVRVQMGSMQMSLSVSDIEALPAGDQKAQARHSRGTRVIDQDRPATPEAKIDLRGIRFEEAMSALSHYLDQAYRSGGMAEVTIVHGLGSGAIREGARGILKELPYIKDFRDGGAGMGGSGATIVEFDRD